MNEIGDGELKVLALVGFVTNSGKWKTKIQCASASWSRYSN